MEHGSRQLGWFAKRGMRRNQKVLFQRFLPVLEFMCQDFTISHVLRCDGYFPCNGRMGVTCHPVPLCEGSNLGIREIILELATFAA